MTIPFNTATELLPGTQELLQQERFLTPRERQQYQFLARQTRQGIDQCIQQLRRYQYAQFIYASLLSGERKLPLQILSKILILAVEPTTIQSDPVLCTSTAASFSAVSRRWRTLALSTPPLWRAFRVHLNLKAQYSEAINSRVKLYVERSKCSPLSLEMILSEEGSGISPSAADLLNILSSAQSGSRSISISSSRFYYEDDTRRVFQRLCSSSTSIEALTLCDKRKKHQLLDALAAWPSHLRSLSFGVCFSVLPQQISESTFPFHQLVHLRINCSLAVGLTILGMSPKLESLHVILPTPDSDDSSFDKDDPTQSKRKPATTRRRYPLKKLQFLRDLTVELDGLFEPDNLLHFSFLPVHRVLYSISAPNLVSLLLRSSATHCEESYRCGAILEDGVREITSRLVSPLKRFVANSVPLTDAILLKLFSHFSGVEEMVLAELRKGEHLHRKRGRMTNFSSHNRPAENRMVTIPFINAISAAPNVNTIALLPHLRHLDLHLHHGYPGQAIEAMLEKRLPTLRSCVLRLGSKDHQLDVARLRSLQRNGMAVRLFFETPDSSQLLVGYSVANKS
ncbi:hypothetical protein VNI00_014082 [Paramarasmius palmivorus]|uniref:F-box domain-containing protein n=1 Tax=Paramarasmius palmivorus TaxID=297713 RepID=A0AAW0BU89_9AGAR